MEYSSFAYFASVQNGKVHFGIEYMKNGRIIYSCEIPYSEYVNAIAEIEEESAR